jgi:hypothetical protein
MSNKSYSSSIVMGLMLLPIFAIGAYNIYQYCSSITRVHIIRKDSVNTVDFRR